MRNIKASVLAANIVLLIALVSSPGSVVAEAPDVKTTQHGSGTASWEWTFPFGLGLTAAGTHSDQVAFDLYDWSPCRYNANIDWCSEFIAVGNIATAACYWDSAGGVEGTIQENSIGPSKVANFCSGNLGVYSAPQGPCAPEMAIGTEDDFEGTSVSSTGVCTH